MYIKRDDFSQRLRPSLYNQAIPWFNHGLCFISMDNKLNVASWDMKQTCNVDVVGTND